MRWTTWEGVIVSGDFWWWNGDEDSAPCLVTVFYSGFADNFFVPMGQHGWTRPQDVKEMDGWWMEAVIPNVPTRDEQEAMKTSGKTRLREEPRLTGKHYRIHLPKSVNRAVVTCVRCGASGASQLFSGAMSAYHDLQCFSCHSTNLDTAALEKAFDDADMRYGFGKRNVLASRAITPQD